MIRPLLLLLLAALAALPAAQAQGIYPGNAVRVNDEMISYQRFQGFYVEYRNSKGVQVGARGDQLELMKELRKEAMDLIVEQEIVAQAAESEGIAPDTVELEEYLEELRSTFNNDMQFRMKLEADGFTEESFRRHVGRMLAAKVYLDRIRVDAADVRDAEVKRFYEDNPERLKLPEQVRVRHILITWKPMGTQDDRAAVRKQMQPILERARAGEDFAALAREFSEDSATKGNGGDTGFFVRGTMVPQFEAAAFALQPGQISDPVDTTYGVHILKLEERKAPEMVPYDEIRDYLREHLSEQKMEAAVRKKIDELLAAADVEVLIPLSASN